MMQASINKSTHVGQPVFSVLFALFSLAGDSPPASKRTKIPRKSKAVRCEAVLPEQKCSQTRKRPQRILCVFSRALTQYEGISARQNRVCPCQSTQTIPYRTTSPIAAAFGEVVRLGQECQKRSFIRLFSSGVFVVFSVRCFFYAGNRPPIPKTVGRIHTDTWNSSRRRSIPPWLMAGI